MRTRILLCLAALALAALLVTRPFPGTANAEVVVPPRASVPVVEEPVHPTFETIRLAEEGLALVWLTPVELPFPRLDT